MHGAPVHLIYKGKLIFCECVEHCARPEIMRIARPSEAGPSTHTVNSPSLDHAANQAFHFLILLHVV